jgi:hypothetical protein
MGIGFPVSKTISVSIARASWNGRTREVSKTFQHHHPDIRFMIETEEDSLPPFLVWVKRVPNDTVVYTICRKPTHTLSTCHFSTLPITTVCCSPNTR